MGLKSGGLQTGGVRNLSEISEIPDSVVTLYEFEDDSDTTTAIDSFNNNDGTINGATYTTTSAVDSLALSFDSGDTVVFPTLISDTTVDLSVSLYVRADSFNGDFEPVFQVEATGSSSSSIQIQTMSDGRIRWMVHHGGFTDVFTPAVPTNTYAHIVGVYKGENQIEVYLDGVLEDTRSVSGRTRDPVDYWALESPGGRIVDDVRVYSKALTSTEVSNLYNTDSISS